MVMIKNLSGVEPGIRGGYEVERKDMMFRGFPIEEKDKE
jgi:hypothetical protein